MVYGYRNGVVEHALRCLNVATRIRLSIGSEWHSIRLGKGTKVWGGGAGSEGRAGGGSRDKGTAKKQKNSIYRKPKKVEVGGEEEGECFKALSCLPSGL